MPTADSGVVRDVAAFQAGNVRGGQALRLDRAEGLICPQFATRLIRQELGRICRIHAVVFLRCMNNGRSEHRIGNGRCRNARSLADAELLVGFCPVRNALVKVLLDARRADAVPPRHRLCTVKGDVHLFRRTRGGFLNGHHHHAGLGRLRKDLRGGDINRVVRREAGTLQILRTGITSNIGSHMTAGSFRQGADDKDGVIAAVDCHCFRNGNIDLDDLVNGHALTPLFVVQFQLL